jgi:ribosomal biogenesis protein LAS1
MAIDYLHHYAFLPLLASTSDTNIASAVLPSRIKAEDVVKRWKKAMKLRVRDKLVGEENETGREMKKIKRELEAIDPEDLAAALVSTEGLIPLARKWVIPRVRKGYD